MTLIYLCCCWIHCCFTTLTGNGKLQVGVFLKIQPFFSRETYDNNTNAAAIMFLHFCRSDFHASDLQKLHCISSVNLILTLQ